MSSKKGDKAAKAAKRSSKLVDAAEVGDVETMARVMSSGPKLDLDALVTHEDCINADTQEKLPGFGLTALHAAVAEQQAAAVRFLLDRGANPSIAHERGVTPLMSAGCKGNQPIVRMLLEAKADPNVQDEFGITPLIHSAARGYAQAVDMLLRAGAKAGMMDGEGKNALDYSTEYDDVMQMLSAVQTEGPSMCSTFRDSPAGDGMDSYRGGGASYRGGGSSYRGESSSPSSPSMSTPRNAGGATPRMTPRVPNAGEVSQRLTPRAPNPATPQRAAYRGKAQNIEISPEHVKQMGSLDRDKMLYLSKKLVHLSILLEQDTVVEDFKYPSFHSPMRR